MGIFRVYDNDAAKKRLQKSFEKLNENWKLKMMLKQKFQKMLQFLCFVLVDFEVNQSLNGLII
jgi:hypothetical protein